MKRPSILFLYSGQGSQYYQMGRALYQQHSLFRHHMQELDEYVCQLTGTSILAEMYHPIRNYNHTLNRTFYSHCSIFMIESALTSVLKNYGIMPDAVLGSSLGEFAASVAANVWDNESALRAVISQAEYLENRCSAGGMLAFLHDHKMYYEHEMLWRNSEIAAIYHDHHFILSGAEKNKGSRGLSEEA